MYKKFLATFVSVIIAFGFVSILFFVSTSTVGAVPPAMTGTFSPTTSSCVGTNFNTNGAASGTITVSPTSTTNYSISCTGPNGQVSGQTMITVSPPFGTPGAIPKSSLKGNISASPNPCSIISPATKCTTYLTWSTANVTKVKVSLSIDNDENEVPTIYDSLSCKNKNCPISWIKANTNYDFRLRDASNNDLLASISVTGKAISGTLTSSSPFCLIDSGKNSCPVNLSWTVTNPIGPETAITARKMAKFISPSVYRGGPTEFIIPYLSGSRNTPSPRTFYLYNNGSLLAQTSVTAGCASGASWDDSKCMPFSPNATISVNPAFIFSGEISTITWSSSNADSCVGTNFNTNNAPDGTVVVSPILTTTYSIVCTKFGVQTQAQATVTIITTEKRPIFKEN